MRRWAGDRAFLILAVVGDVAFVAIDVLQWFDLSDPTLAGHLALTAYCALLGLALTWAMIDADHAFCRADRAARKA